MTDIESSASQFLVYADEAGRVRLDVRFDDSTVWLNQDQLVTLFDSSNYMPILKIKGCQDGKRPVALILMIPTPFLVPPRNRR